MNTSGPPLTAHQKYSTHLTSVTPIWTFEKTFPKIPGRVPFTVRFALCWVFLVSTSLYHPYRTFVDFLNQGCSPYVGICAVRIRFLGATDICIQNWLWPPTQQVNQAGVLHAMLTPYGSTYNIKCINVCLIHVPHYGSVYVGYVLQNYDCRRGLLGLGSLG